MAMNLKHKRVLQNSLTTWRTWIISWHQSWRSYTWTRNLWTATFLSQFFHFFPTTWYRDTSPICSPQCPLDALCEGSSRAEFHDQKVEPSISKIVHWKQLNQTSKTLPKLSASLPSACLWSLWWNVSQIQILLSHPSLQDTSFHYFILFLDLTRNNGSFANQVTWVWHQADVIADLKLPAAHCRGAGGPQFQAANLGENPNVLHIALDTLSWFQSNSIHFVSFHSLHFVGHVASQIFFTAYIVSVCSSLAHQTSEERCRTPQHFPRELPKPLEIANPDTKPSRNRKKAAKPQNLMFFFFHQIWNTETSNPNPCSFTTQELHRNCLGPE